MWISRHDAGDTLVGIVGKGHNLTRVIDTLDKEMREAAASLEFETVARVRNRLKKLRGTEVGLVD